MLLSWHTLILQRSRETKVQDYRGQDGNWKCKQNRRTQRGLIPVHNTQVCKFISNRLLAVARQNCDTGFTRKLFIILHISVDEHLYTKIRTYNQTTFVRCMHWKPEEEGPLIFATPRSVIIRARKARWFQSFFALLAFCTHPGPSPGPATGQLSTVNRECKFHRKLRALVIKILHVKGICSIQATRKNFLITELLLNISSLNSDELLVGHN